jgi:hypothetical protein
LCNLKQTTPMLWSTKILSSNHTGCYLYTGNSYLYIGHYYSIITWCFSYWSSYRSEACCIGLRRSRTPIQQTGDLYLGQYEKHHVMIPLLINQFNISRDFSLQLSKCLADSDLVVIGLTGIGPIRKISVLDWFLPYWPNESFYIVSTDFIIWRLINQS